MTTAKDDQCVVPHSRQHPDVRLRYQGIGDQCVHARRGTERCRGDKRPELGEVAVEDGETVAGAGDLEFDNSEDES